MILNDLEIKEIKSIVKSTIFHEAIHACEDTSNSKIYDGATRSGHPKHEDGHSGDLVYGCEHLCASDEGDKSHVMLEGCKHV